MPGIMAPLPTSSPPVNAPQSVQKVSGGSRTSAATGSAGRSGARGQHSGDLKHGKVRGPMKSEDAETRAPKAGARDGTREKAPSKDGTVQRTAKEVEGLKDLVCAIPISYLTNGQKRIGRRW